MRLRRKLYWVAVLYFAEGFPFGVVYDLIPVYFRSFGVSLTDIGLLSLVGLPWSFKVFWSPLVDRYGDRRHWMVACLLLMGTVLAAVPLFPPGDPRPGLWALLFAFTTLSATQDIAIDAYTIGLMSKGQEGAANSFRVSAYRAALVVSGGGLVALAGILSWRVLIWIAAGIFYLMAFFAHRAPAIPVSAESRRAFFRPLWVWMKRPGSWAVLLFILTYKVGDSSMAPMIKPFWLDRGLSPAEIGLISTTIGVIAAVAGAMIGGAWTTKIGIFRALWLLGLLQAVSNLGYTCAAAWDVPRGYIYLASVIESFTGGLGTAAFLSFLMNICDKEHAGVQYALLSALFGFTRSIAGAFSGWGADHLGYAPYFGLTFLLAFPAYLLLPWIRTWIRGPTQPETT